MLFQLIPVNGTLYVEGTSDAAAVGDFAGHVIGVGLQEYDPVATPRASPAHEAADGGGPEGLFGWGTTHFLVCDPDKPAPCWISKADVRSHRYEPERPLAERS